MKLITREPLVVGRYACELFRKGELIDQFEVDNICVNEGLIAMLNVMFAGVSVISNWYIGLFTNNYTPVATDTASSIVGNAGEFTSYSGGARPNYSPAAATQPNPSLNNTNNKASFTFTGSGNLMGAFLISSATPGANSGTLYSAAQFASSKNVGNGDQLTMSYTTGLSN